MPSISNYGGMFCHTMHCSAIVTYPDGFPNKCICFNNPSFFLFGREIGEAFKVLGQDPDCRVIILSGNGKAFCSGKLFKIKLWTPNMYY
jgi:hypothetical protein